MAKGKIAYISGGEIGLDTGKTKKNEKGESVPDVEVFHANNCMVTIDGVMAHFADINNGDEVDLGTAGDTVYSVSVTRKEGGVGKAAKEGAKGLKEPEHKHETHKK